MPRDGNGNYSRPIPPYVSGTVISATDHNTEHDDFAAALTASVARDGQSPMTGHLPMGNNRVIDIANAIARNHAATLAQVQDFTATWGGIATGSANSKSISVTPSLPAYVNGQFFRFINNTPANTGPVVFSVSGNAFISLKHLDGSELAAGDLPANWPALVVYYNGEAFLVNPPPLRVNVQVFTTSGTWNKPARYSPDSVVFIQCWGGGGSGARASGAAGGGGGGGGYNEGWLRLSDMSNTHSVTVGAGGASKTGSNQDGDAGGNSAFGSIITAFGGGGGAASFGGGGGGPLSPGLSNSISGTPRYLVQGNLLVGQGTDVAAASAAQVGHFHGGGGGAGSTGALRAGANSFYGGGGGAGGTGASGGTSRFGGNGGNSGGTGTAGAVPGGGGGAGTSTSGAGGDGLVRVFVFPA
jgi:hypothetical protein